MADWVPGGGILRVRLLLLSSASHAGLSPNWKGLNLGLVRQSSEQFVKIKQELFSSLEHLMAVFFFFFFFFIRKAANSPPNPPWGSNLRSDRVSVACRGKVPPFFFLFVVMSVSQ